MSRAPGGKWSILDLQSKNGTFQDGALRPGFVLTPGVVVGMGGLSLVAESPRLIELRELVARLLGWSDEAIGNVDLALRSLRMAATRREGLQLAGDGDLAVIAQLLHRNTLGDARTFAMCDPRRKRTDRNARSPANYPRGMEALEAAAGGTVCVWLNRPPDDFDRLLAAVHEPSSRVQLVLCTHAVQPLRTLITYPMTLPPLAARARELDRIITAFGRDATASLGGAFTAADLAFVRRDESETLDKISIATLRIVAIRVCAGSITRAADLLAMSHSALSEWVARRALPE